MISPISRPSDRSAAAEELARRALAAALNTDSSIHTGRHFSASADAGVVEAAATLLRERSLPSPVVDRALQMLDEATFRHAAEPSS